ncbi:MAG: pyridoxamine 5'-phosphate oxidase family protein [Verrucomicrobiales bacterium]
MESTDDPEVLVELASAVVRRAKFPFLATVGTDGQPRVRPVSPVRVEAGFVIFVANLRRYGKTAEIAAEPRVELCYLDEHHDQVRVTAVAEVVQDPEVLASIWSENPLLRKYLGTPDNPELIIYRCRPTRVRFMREWALEYREVPLACGK